MLLHCSISYCQTSNGSSPFTGKQFEATVIVPIKYIRKADSIMIDYNYLKGMDDIKDSIINDYSIVNNNLNQDLTKLKSKLDKTTKHKETAIIVSIATSIALVLTLIFK